MRVFVVVVVVVVGKRGHRFPPYSELLQLPTFQLPWRLVLLRPMKCASQTMGCDRVPRTRDCSWRPALRLIFHLHSCSRTEHKREDILLRMAIYEKSATIDLVMSMTTGLEYGQLSLIVCLLSVVR